MSENPWHLLQISDVLDLEMATALAASVPLIAWEPQRVMLPGAVTVGTEAERSSGPQGYDGAGDSSFRIRNLPLVRGFAKPPMTWMTNTNNRVLRRLLQQTPQPERAPLICTTPYFAGVAEAWPGPVVYWLTDLIAEYGGANRDAVHQLDRRMVRAATLLCPNSRRLERYLIEEAGADPAKMQVLPNATRQDNLLAAIPQGPARLPKELAGTARPCAGVIGNLAGNMDWLLLDQLVERTPWLTWVFVGPTEMPVTDQPARTARRNVMGRSNTCFVGKQAYGALAGFAQSFDLAVLPYKRCEPTYSGSSTRFYEHLAACRPMLATRGLEELHHKTPLLELFDTADEGVAAIERLRAHGFEDGHTEARWRASQEGTWQYRARTLRMALQAKGCS